MPAAPKILIVDDNPLNTEILEELLEDYQHETASCGEEALVIAAMFQPDIILLDIMMPDLSGYEVCQILRKNPTLNRVKIIMVSAKGMLGERLEGYKAGADDYIVKPFDDDELLAKINVYARLKSEEETSKFKKDFVKLLLLEANTPLNNIKIPINLLMENVDLDVEERQKFLQQIRKGIDDIEQLFQEVSSLSELASGTWTNPFVTVNLCDLMRKSLDLILPQASKHEVEVNHTLPHNAYTLANADQILRVLGIILDNAIKFSPPKGKVNIEISDSDGYYNLTITDHGKGIDLPNLKKQVDENVKTDKDKGNYVQGPSLTVANHIMQLHNGSIDFENVKDGGTAATVRLPIQFVG